MAKLVLKFENAVQKEVPLRDGIVSIGRLADNTIQIDTPGVSSRHCWIGAEGGHYFVEDSNSKNGTFVNKQRITRAQLIDGDELTIDKHIVTFVDVAVAATAQKKIDGPVSQVPATVAFEPGQEREMLDMIKNSIAGGMAKPPLTPAPTNERIGTLTVLRGKTDQPRYLLARKLFVIGKADTANIRLKGFFAPKSAAVIDRREGKYFVAPAGKSVKVKINEARVAATHELNDGDILEVASVKMTFSYRE